MDQPLAASTPADIMGLDERGRKIGVVIMVGGVLAAIAGAIVYMRFRRRTDLLGRALPEAVNTVHAGDMTLTHFRDKRMPIDKRLAILQDLTWKSVQDPRNRKLALEMTRDCPERDGRCEARAVYEHVKRRVRYTGDVASVRHGSNGPVEGVDLFQSAFRTWEFGGGDCDDMAVLVATSLTLNGVPAKFRVTAPRRDAEFSHIYVLAGLPKLRPTEWVPIDATLPGYNFAKEVPYGRHVDYVA